MASLHSTPAEHLPGVKHVSHDAAYVKVLITLAVFTAIELAIPSILGGIRPLMIVLLMAAAACKATLVALYYMHLKFEKGALGLIAALPLVLVAILILTVHSDISAVDQGGWTVGDAGAVHGTAHE